MRTALVIIAIVAFVGLGIIDLTQGAWRTGIAAFLLAVANGLLLLKI
jgi:hypothetical protein